MQFLDKSKQFKKGQVTTMTKYLKQEATARKVIQYNQQMGEHESTDIKVSGRIILDMYDVIRRDYKLGS